MNESDESKSISGQVATLRTIIAAMATGPLVFAAVVLLAIPGDPQNGLLARFGLLFALVCLGVHQPIARKLRSQALTSDQRLGVYTTSTIVSAAILEGGCFLNLIAYMLERDPWSLAMAGLLCVALLFKLPSRRRVEAWLEQEDRRRREQGAFDA